MRSLAWLWLIYHAALTNADLIPVDQRCLVAISTAYTYITFVGSKRGSLLSRCENPLGVTSIYASSDIFCRPDERAAGLTQLATECREFGFELLPREHVAENLTDDAISRMLVVDYQELPAKQPIDFPVLLSSSHYNVVFKTIDTWQFETWTHYAYGYAGYAYWAGILAVGILHRLLRYLMQLRSSRSPQSNFSATSNSSFHNIHRWIQTHLLVPGPLPSQGREFLWWTFSTRMEAIVILLFWVLSAILCSVSYRLFAGNIYWSEPSAQLLRYIADRTGIVSFANLPLIWLFAGRNNICAWATGWNFATFNLFHRHIAWIATIQATIHTAMYLVLFFQNSNPWRKLRKPYLLWGTGAMVLMILVLPLAVKWFRHRAYETFLFIHIVFSIGLLVGCFYHTIIFEGHEYWFYLWLPVGIWAFDRLLRLIRVVYCNFHVRANAGSRIQYTTSTATYDKAADLVRLEVVSGSPLLRPSAGQYYFLYQPFRLTGWESHPFTVGSWSYEVGSGSLSSTNPWSSKDNETVDISQMPLLSDDNSDSEQNPAGTTRPLSKESRKLKLVFWIRPFDGWTRHLRRQCLESPDRTVDVHILLEGPYGHEYPLWGFDSVLLIAGGTGIASAVPYIQDHLARSAPDSDSAGSNPDDDGNGPRSRTRVKDMQLIWVTRQAAFIQQVTSRELSLALSRDDFRASFYSTLPTTKTHRDEPDHDELAAQSDSNDALIDDKNVQIFDGRPDLQSLILAHAEEARRSDCSAAVLVCGPPAMADEARAAVHSAMRQGCHSLQYVEESFSW